MERTGSYLFYSCATVVEWDICLKVRHTHLPLNEELDPNLHFDVEVLCAKLSTKSLFSSSKLVSHLHYNAPKF